MTQMPTWLRRFAETKARPLGFEFVGYQGNGHPRFYNADKGVYFTTALTPSDWRGEKNSVADMERLSGRKLPRQKAGRARHVKVPQARFRLSDSEKSAQSHIDQLLTRAERLAERWDKVKDDLRFNEEAHAILLDFEEIEAKLRDFRRVIPPLVPPAALPRVWDEILGEL